MIFFLAGPLTEEERLNRQPRSIQDQIVSTAAQCMKGVVNRFKDSGFDIDCLQSNNCNQADVNRLANNALGYLEKVQGGGCMTNSNCSPISRCNSKYISRFRIFFRLLVSRWRDLKFEISEDYKQN